MGEAAASMLPSAARTLSSHVPMVRVFGLDKPERLLEVLQGSDAGTFVHP